MLKKENLLFKTYRKRGHPQNAEQGQGWEETKVNDTLNIFDNSETRTPTLICEQRVFENHSQDTRYREMPDVCQPISATFGMGGNNQPFVVKTVFDASRRHNYEPFGDVIETVQAAYGTGGNNMPIVLENSLGGQDLQHKENEKMEDCKEPIYSIGHDERSTQLTQDGKTDPLTSSDYKDPIKVVNETVVRRLTPTECERLQNFPDGWTDIGDWIDEKGKTHKGESDSPRYKALGNSIALPFWQWMAERMTKVLKDDGVENPTMASLFDGIGGFPLVYLRCGCKPVWASEIEQFPIAVTKKHFGDEDAGIEGDIEKYL